MKKKSLRILILIFYIFISNSNVAEGFQTNTDKLKSTFGNSIQSKKEINHNILSNEIDILFSKDKYRETIFLLNDAIKTNPNEAIYYEKRGFCYLKIKNKNQAIRDFFKAIALYNQADSNGTESADYLIKQIYSISKEYRNNKAKISALYPQIDIFFENYYETKIGNFVYYIHPKKWDELTYENKINLLQEVICFSMFSQILNKEAPLYFLTEGDIKIRSSIDGMQLIKRLPGRGKQEKLFKDSSLQSLCENFRLTPAYIKENPVTQDDLLNAYLDKVYAIVDDNTFGNINRSFSIKINREGKILLITLNDSPWKDKIDGNALKIIRSLEPFPKIPNEYRKDNIEIRTLINISDKD